MATDQKIPYSQLAQKIYNFIPPEGEYPPCYGICRVLNKQNGFGTMLHLEQLEDPKNKLDMWHDATGYPGKLVPSEEPGKMKRIDVPREIGRKRWVKYDSFFAVEEVYETASTEKVSRTK